MSKVLAWKNIQQWRAPSAWHRVECIEAHTGGEPLRVIVSGWPSLVGKTILEKRKECKQLYDNLRTALMWEPRGHADMYGCVITEPVTANADFGVLFLHNEGYSSMCGHGIIAVVTVAIECGLLPKTNAATQSVVIDTPAGLIHATAHMREQRVRSVSFLNVPSYLAASDCSVAVPGLANVTYDLAWGAAFYAYVDADALGLSLSADNTRQLIDVGMRIKNAIIASAPPVHPESSDLSFLYGTIFVAKAHDARHHSRNVCIFADGEVDRSPTGTGVAGRAAIHYAKKQLALNESIRIESLIGSCFDVAVREQLNYFGYEAIEPEVSGCAHLCGRSSWFIDPDDHLAHGFLIR